MAANYQPTEAEIEAFRRHLTRIAAEAAEEGEEITPGTCRPSPITTGRAATCESSPTSSASAGSNPTRIVATASRSSPQ
jgi:hypothetical protein